MVEIIAFFELEQKWTFFKGLHAFRLPLQNRRNIKYSCDFTPYRPGASMPGITNYFFVRPKPVFQDPLQGIRIDKPAWVKAAAKPASGDRHGLALTSRIQGVP